jgi:hypothetical protein
VAAYFAASTALAIFSGSEEAKMAVWVLDSAKARFCKNFQIVTEIPGSTSKNLAAQSGLFTLLKQAENKRGERFQAGSLEEEFASLQDTPLIKITLTASAAPQVIGLCRLYGVSASTLFPGHDGAARAIADWLNMTKNDQRDFVEFRADTEAVWRFLEDLDGWWRLKGEDHGWEFSADQEHGFLTSFRPPQGGYVEIGTTLTTRCGRRLVVASIRREDGQLMMILMPR